MRNRLKNFNGCPGFTVTSLSAFHIFIKIFFMRKLAVIFFAMIMAFSSNAQPPEPPLEDFVGKYFFPEGSVVPDVDVVLADGALSMHSVAGSSTLTRLGVDSFTIVEFNGIAVFKRGDDKKVKGVHIEAMGYVLDGEKQPSGNWSFRISAASRRNELLMIKP